MYKKCVCLLLFGSLLFATGCGNSVNTNSTSSLVQSEDVSSTDNNGESVEFEKGKIYMDDALLAELEKTEKPKFYMVLVTEHTGADYEKVYEEFVKGKYSIHDDGEFLREHLIYVTPSELKTVKCPEDMSISLQLAYPVEYYFKNLRDIEDWKESLLVDELYVKVVIKVDPDVDYDTQVEITEKFLEDYDIGEHEKERFSYNYYIIMDGRLYLILSKDKIEKMLNDDRVKSIIHTYGTPVEDY